MKTHHTRNGFSLLELLVVMSIMALLTTLATVGYFTATRGMARQRAASGLRNALVLARQRACTDAAKTTVVCFNVWSGAESAQGATPSEKRKACTPTYVICKAIGQFTAKDNDKLYDEFTPLDSMFGLAKNSADVSGSVAPIRLYNLTRGGWSDVYMKVERKAYPDKPGISSANLEFPATDPDGMRSTAPAILFCFTAKTTVNMSGGWKVGDAYGMAVSPIATLPKNIYFGASGDGDLNPDQGSGGSTPPMATFTFYPTGHAESQHVELQYLNPGLTFFKQVKVNMEGEIE